MSVRQSRAVRLQCVIHQPVRLCSRTAVKPGHRVGSGQGLDRRKAPTHRWSPVCTSSRTVGVISSSRRPATSPAGRVSASSNARHASSSSTNTRRSASAPAAASVAAANTNVDTLVPVAWLAASSRAFCSASTRRCRRSAFVALTPPSYVQCTLGGTCRSVRIRMTPAVDRPTHCLATSSGMSGACGSSEPRSLRPAIDPGSSRRFKPCRGLLIRAFCGVSAGLLSFLCVASASVDCRVVGAAVVSTVLNPEA